MRSSAAWGLALALLGAQVQAQQVPADVAAPAASAIVIPVAADGRPSRDAVEAELATLRADPRFGGTQKQKTWRFKERDSEAKKSEPPSGMPAWFKWLGEFGRWMTAAGRLVVWAIAAVLVAVLIVGLRYWIRERAGALRQRTAPLPSHVRDLDIRPESLPDRIGAAAAALWQRGEQRAALSLLYRGALSRLVHVHALPIRAASTSSVCGSRAPYTASCQAPTSRATYPAGSARSRARASATHSPSVLAARIGSACTCTRRDKAPRYSNDSAARCSPRCHSACLLYTSPSPRDS